MQDENKPEKISNLYFLRESFSSDRQDELPPESAIPETERSNKRRIGTQFSPKEITYPTFDDGVLLKLAKKNATEEEVTATADRFFDSENTNLCKSYGGIDALKEQHNHLARMQADLQKKIEETPSIRTLYSKTNLVEPSGSAKVFYVVSFLIVVALFFIDWGNIGVSIQASGEEAFLGEGGLLKALLFGSAIMVFTALNKVCFSGLSRKNQDFISNRTGVVLSIIFIFYTFAFASYYGWTMDDTSLATPPDIYKKIMLCISLLIPPFAIPIIVNKFSKQTNHYKEEEVFHSKEFLALTEELDSVVNHRKDIEQKIMHLEDFRASYLAKKARFAEEFGGYFVDFQVVYLATTNTAIANFRINQKPVLRVFNGDKK